MELGAYLPAKLKRIDGSTRSPGAMRRHRGFLQAENDAGGEPATTNYPRYLCRYVTSAVREPRQSPGARRGERS